VYVKRIRLKSTDFRKRRFNLFISLFLQTGKFLRVLDVGGTRFFWEAIDSEELDRLEIVLLNLTDTETIHPRFTSHVGDACDMAEFQDNEFDVVFSNSVIEHVGDFKQQRRMAQEIKRVGSGYFLQTPNYYFPFETHFRLPLFHYLPHKLQTALLKFDYIGRRYKLHNPELQTAVELVESVRLLTGKELRELFSEAIIVNEKFLGLTKSFMVYSKPMSNNRLHL